MAKEKQISFRPDADTNVLIEKAKAQGINATTFINNQIRSAGQMDFDREVLTIISNLQTILEFAEESVKSEMRKELNRLCRILKS